MSSLTKKQYALAVRRSRFYLTELKEKRSAAHEYIRQLQYRQSKFAENTPEYRAFTSTIKSAQDSFNSVDSQISAVQLTISIFNENLGYDPFYTGMDQ